MRIHGGSAARLSSTPWERRQVLGCAAALAQVAAGETGLDDPAALAAIGAARMRAREECDRVELLMAVQNGVAAEAAARPRTAAEEAFLGLGEAASRC